MIKPTSACDKQSNFFALENKVGFKKPKIYKFQHLQHIHAEYKINIETIFRVIQYIYFFYLNLLFT